MTWRRLLRISHLLLVLSAIFALTAFGVLCIRANALVTRGNQQIDVLAKHTDEWSKAMTHILSRGAAGVDEGAKIIQAEKTYWNQQNKQMGKLFVTLNRSAENLNETIVTLRGAIGTINSKTVELSDESASRLDELGSNLALLKQTQIRLNRSIDALDVPTLGRNVVEISKNLNTTMAHVDKISADAQQYADAFVAPKSKWARFKNFMGLFLARSLAYAVGNHL